MVGFCVGVYTCVAFYKKIFFLVFGGRGTVRERAVSIPPEKCTLKSFAQEYLRGCSYAFRDCSYAFKGNQKNENLLNIHFLYLEASAHMHLWGTEKVSMYQEPP